MQTLAGKEIFEWLYALNPLLAGEIRSKLARGRENKPIQSGSASNTSSTANNTTSNSSVNTPSKSNPIN